MGQWWPWSSRGRTTQPPQPLRSAQATLARRAARALVGLNTPQANRQMEALLADCC